MSKVTRSELKRRRQESGQQQRKIALIMMSAAIVIVVGIIVGVQIYENNRPIGDVNSITPFERPMADGRSAGNPNAPVTIEVFEDFQCPACVSYTENIERQIMEELVASGQVYYVFRHYPFLDNNAATKESDQAANASMCAAEQGRFWDYHDIVFANWKNENEGAYSNRRLVAFAEELDLDMRQFNACFEDNTYKSVIDQDISEGTSMGVQGTPSVFVNGKILTPGYIPSYDEIKTEVDRLLSGN